MGILQVLFIITLITFPLGQAVRLQLGNNINVTAFDCSVLLTGIWWILAALRRSEYKKRFLTKPILLFVLAIIISLVANSLRYATHELLVASLYGVRWFLFACMYFVLSDISGSVKKQLPDWLTVSGAVLLVFGYIQYLWYADLRNLYYLGWDEHLTRMFSTFLDPNFYGAFLVLYFLFLLGRMQRSSPETAPITNVGHPFRERLRPYFYGVLAFGAFIGVFLTTSRSALLMLTVSLITYLIMIHKAKLILVFLGISTLIFLLASPFFYRENINPFRIASSLARVETGQNAISIISQNSILGVGFNAYRYAQYQYGFREPVTDYPNHADSGTDSSLLFVFATTGVLGGLSYCYLLYRMVLLGKRKETQYSTVLVVSVVGLLVSSLFINSLFYPLLMYWIWVLAGLNDYT